MSRQQRVGEIETIVLGRNHLTPDWLQGESEGILVTPLSHSIMVAVPKFKMPDVDPSSYACAQTFCDKNMAILWNVIYYKNSKIT